MRLLSHCIFGLVSWGARKGIAPERKSDSAASARHTGIRGETYAYWYLRRHGYTIVARNFRVTGLKGEIDLIGYDGEVLTFIEVKTRTSEGDLLALPEDAVTSDKRRFVARIARQFLAEWRIPEARCRFDVVAIESHPGRSPLVRLHKGAFT